MSDPLPRTLKLLREGQHYVVIRSYVPIASSSEPALTFAINYRKA
mgnify:CR=1 FL=1